MCLPFALQGTEQTPFVNTDITLGFSSGKMVKIGIALFLWLVQHDPQRNYFLVKKLISFSMFFNTETDANNP